MAVKFCVVATDAEAAKRIVVAAKPIAALSPFWVIVSRGESGFPSEADIARWAKEKGVAPPGSVTLHGDGSLSSVLSVDDAQNAALIENAFLNASS